MSLSVSGSISLACLLITGGLATWGVFSRHFDDSLLQRIGLSAVAVACILRVPDKLADMPTPPEILLAQVGLCVFGVGTVIKLWGKGRALDRRRARQLHELRSGDATRVGAGHRRDDMRPQ